LSAGCQQGNAEACCNEKKALSLFCTSLFYQDFSPED